MAQKMIMDPDGVSSLTLAFVGDSVYEVIVRTISLMKHNGNVNDVNKCAKSLSNAVAQAKIADLLMEDMTENEVRIFKRGRNAKSVSAPKTCSISEYRKATGLEALCAYLYLSGDVERAKELVTIGIDKYEQSKEA